MTKSGRALRLVSSPLVFALISMLAVLLSASSVSAATPAVTMFDNDAAPIAFDPGQALWGFAPTTLTVPAGQTILFLNPASNHYPHTVTSLERVGGPFGTDMKVGGRFDSSPDQQSLVMPGQSFSLDTSQLQPGNYTYYCRLHPWMVSAFTVVAPGQ